MSIPDFSAPEAMRGVLERMVKYAGYSSNDRKPLWSHVGDITSHGSGYSAAICREFGEDPDRMVGGLREEWSCNECGTCLSCLCSGHEEHSPGCESGEGTENV